MDILEQYEKENPEVLPQTFQCDSSEEYGALTCTVMRLSGGRIGDAKQANYVLFGFATIMIVISILIFLNIGSGSQQFLPLDFSQIDQSQYEQR